MKSTTQKRIIDVVREEIYNERYYLPDIKNKLCNVLSDAEIFGLGQLVAKAISDDTRLKIIMSRADKESA